MMKEIEINLQNEQATLALGAKLSVLIDVPFSLYLKGQLGAGKTTLVRGFLKALGHEGTVKSPTYTIVEPYVLPNKNIFHFDLYRMNHPGELEFVGIRDYFKDAICLLEWPENGGDYLPQPDLTCQLVLQGEGRKAILSALTERGQQVLTQLST